MAIFGSNPKARHFQESFEEHGSHEILPILTMFHNPSAATELQSLMTFENRARL